MSKSASNLLSISFCFSVWRRAFRPFYKIEVQSIKQAKSSTVATKLDDLSLLWQETSYQTGQLIALLIASLGLILVRLPICVREHLNLEFQMLTLVKRWGQTDCIPTERDSSLFEEQPVGTYLFDKKGQPYSRQWFFNRLSEFVASIGHREMDSSILHDQYILAQLANGKSPDDLAKQLGAEITDELRKYR